MTEPSAADELRAAATKLRDLATAATPGPWTIAKVWPYTDPLLMSRYEETPEDGDVLIAGHVDVELDDQAYIAAMHPGVGAALADWLDHEAESLAAVLRKYPDMPTDIPGLAPALAVARAINQQEPTT